MFITFVPLRASFLFELHSFSSLCPSHSTSSLFALGPRHRCLKKGRFSSSFFLSNASYCRLVAEPVSLMVVRSEHHRITGSKARVTGSEDHWIRGGSQDHRIRGSLDHRIRGSLDHRIRRSPDQRITESLVHRIRGSEDHWIT